MADGEAQAAQAGLPWPEGDADGLRRRSRSLAGAARSVAAVASRVGREQASRAGWVGAAADRYEASVTAEADALRRTADGLGDAAGALANLAGVVDEAQREVARWAARIVELQDRANSAGAAVPGLLDTMAAWGHPALLRELQEGQRAARRAARLDAELLALRATAEPRAERACRQLETADSRCATTLGALTCAAPLPGEVPASPPATPLAMAVGGAFAPVYHFDGGEDHYPMDPRAWLANADLKGSGDDRYWDPRGKDVRNGDLANATLPFVYHVTKDGQLQLEYGTFYPFNDFPRVPTLPRPRFLSDAPLLGPAAKELSKVDHEGDFEPVTVQFRDGRPTLVDYEAHGHAGTVPWAVAAGGSGRGRTQVYPARGGHGNRPTTRRYDSSFTAMPILRDLPVVTHPWRDDPGTEGGTWDPAGDLLDARSVPALRDDARWGENTGSNPTSFLVQGRPPDLDGEQPHEEPRSAWEGLPMFGPRLRP